MMDTKKREKIDWLYLITDLGLLFQFEDYKAIHNVERVRKGLKRISDKRLARAFCSHMFKLLGFDFRSLYNSNECIGLYEYYKKIDRLDLFSKVYDKIRRIYGIGFSFI